MISFKQFLLEGGAAGHMDHPFDLPAANTGNDLIKIFQKAALSIRNNPAAVKIDGINCSLKLITTQDGSKEFAMDQGSKKEIDIAGITARNIEQRFQPSPSGQPHGMIAKGKLVLDIFNAALPSITNELKKLGLFNNDHLMLNMEFVEGHTNVIGYANNFLAIHGVNQITKLTSLARGSGKRTTTEVKVDKKALQSLIEKVKPVATKYGFNVVSEFPVKVPASIDLAPALNSEFAIKYDDAHGEVKTLQAWLGAAKNPRGSRIQLTNGKSIGAMSLENYKNVSSGAPVSKLLAKPTKQAIKLCADGAIFYHATIVLGELIKQQSQSDLGPIVSQEGIVIRDNKISSRPFKITGNFILGKDQGKIRQLKAAPVKGEEEEYGYKGFLKNMHTVNSTSYMTNTAATRAGGMGGY